MEKRGQVKERGWVFGGVFCTTDGTDATEEPQWGGVWGVVYGRFAVRLGDEGCGLGGYHGRHGKHGRIAVGRRLVRGLWPFCGGAR
jgi:hypothetical protein